MLAAKVSAVQATLTHYFHAAPIKNQHCGSAILGAIIWRTPLNFNCAGSPTVGRNGAQRFSQSNQRCNQALPLRRAVARTSRAREHVLNVLEQRYKDCPPADDPIATRQR